MSAVGQKLAESTAAISRLRRELAEVREQIAIFRAGEPVRPHALGALAGAIVAVWFASLIPSCASNEEVARVTSPSGAVDAIVMRSNGGATTSYGDRVMLVRAGRSHRWGTVVADFDGATGVHPKWESDGLLEIEYADARSAQLTSPERLVVDDRAVWVALAKGGGKSD